MALTLVLAGCGGRDEAADRAACIEEFTAGAVEEFENIAPDFLSGEVEAPRDAIRTSAERLCTAAVAEGLTGEEGDFEERVLALLRSDPEALRPLCSAVAAAGLEELPEQLRTPELAVELELAGSRYCEFALEEGYLSLDRRATPDEIERIYSDHPEILYPVCVTTALAAYETLPQEFQTAELQEATEAAGRRYCDIALAEGITSFRGPEAEATVERIYREHPELTTETCVLSAMVGYESAPLVVRGVEVSPNRAERYFRRYCVEVAEAGVIADADLEVTPSQERQLRALAQSVLRRMVAAGELP